MKLKLSFHQFFLSFILTSFNIQVIQLPLSNDDYGKISSFFSDKKFNLSFV